MGQKLIFQSKEQLLYTETVKIDKGLIWRRGKLDQKWK